MTIISRYVFGQAAGALLLILISLSGIVWIALALRQLNVVTSQGQDALMLLRMTTLALPNLMALIAPFALLIAAIHTLNRLNSDSELIVLTAAGAMISTIARPLLLLAFLVAGALSLVNHYVMPSSLRLLRQYIVEVRTDLLTQVIQPGRFSSPENGLTFHIRERSPEGELRGLIMHDVRNAAQSQSYLADRADIVKQDAGAYLLMNNGHILRRAGPDEPAQIVGFDKYAVDLDRFEPQDTDGSDLKPRERYYSELVNPEPDSASFRKAPGQFRAEIHERFASPLYPIAFVCIALACVGQARSTRQNKMQQIILGFSLAAGCRLAGLAVNNMVALNPGAVPLMYALPVLAIVASVYSMMAGAKPGRATSSIDRLVDGLSEFAIRIATLFRRPSPALTRRRA